VELMDCIRTRRSVRAYKQDPVPDSVIESLVTAAMWAPSASNRQELVFIAVSGSDEVLRLSPLAPGLLGEPPAVIVVACDRTRLPASHQGDHVSEVVSMDVAMAAQNLLLAATDLGLGSCAIHSFRPGPVGRLLRLPDHILPMLLVGLGYPARIPPPPRRRPLTDVLNWGGPRARNADGQETLTAPGGTAQQPGAAAQSQVADRDAQVERRLVVYLLSAARGLMDEPLHYGPMRLLDAACRLGADLQGRGEADPAIARVLDDLARQKEKGSQGYPQLASTLDSALAVLATGL
jgi:nitroreductase